MASEANKEDLVEQFCSITGSQRETAKQLLEVCNYNLNLAIEMHMDNRSPASTPVTPQASSSSSSSQDATECVRAPIPQKTERLVEETYNIGFRRRRKAKSVFDGFRNFQMETRLQEEAMTNHNEPTTSAARKRKTLEDLFRPPIDLMFKGSFHAAREAGETQNKWLMVNIQNSQEFVCQTLNRDVWSNQTVKLLIHQHFLFWQVYHDSEEGKKYMQFYNVADWPYIAVLDPITGEKMAEWTSMDSTTFCDVVTEFLSMHPSPDGSSSSSPPMKKQKTEGILDANEESQIEAAIKASLAETTAASVAEQIAISSDSSDEEIDLETFTDSEDDSSKSASPVKNSISCNKSHVEKSDIVTNSIESDSAISVTDLTASCSRENSNQEASESCSKLTAECSSSFRDISNTEKSDLTNSDTKRENMHTVSGNTGEDWRSYIGSDQDPESNLVIRFPDGSRKQFKQSSSSKLRALVLFVVSEGFSSDKYELVTTFPKRRLSSLDQEQTLKDAGLFPQETIFVQET